MNAFRSTLDLLVVLVVTTASAAVVVAHPSVTILGVLFGLPLILFLPGYALVSAFYPEGAGERSSDRWNDTSSSRRTLASLERFLLSVLLSVGIVPLIALAVDFTAYDIARTPVLVGVVGWVYVFTLVGLVRRLMVPPERRFSVAFGGWIGQASSSFDRRPSSLRPSAPFEPRTETELLLNVAVVVGVVLLAGSVAFAAASNPSGDSFTEFYLLSENEDGDLVSEDFQTTFDGGDPVPVTVAIGNHEGETVEYTTVVLLQEMTGDGEVESQSELDRFETTVEYNTTETVDREVLSPTTGDDLRLTLLLYTGDAPEDPTTENAYRSVHLWITVEG